MNWVGGGYLLSEILIWYSFNSYSYIWPKGQNLEKIYNALNTHFLLKKLDDYPRLHINIIKCLICWTKFFFHYCVHFVPFFLSYSSKLKEKNNLHCWIFRGEDRNEKSKRKRIIYTCTWPKLYLLQLTEKINIFIVFISHQWIGI